MAFKNILYSFFFHVRLLQGSLSRVFNNFYSNQTWFSTFMTHTKEATIAFSCTFQLSRHTALFLRELQASLALGGHTAQLPGLLFLGKLYYFFSSTITKVIQIISIFLLHIAWSLFILLFSSLCFVFSFSLLAHCFLLLLTSFCIPCQHSQWFITHHDCCAIHFLPCKLLHSSK